MTEPLLTVISLNVAFGSPDRMPSAVRDLSFEVRPRETLAIVGESGSGKSTTALALLGLLPGHATVSGSAVFEGDELLGRDDRYLTKVRGARIAYVPQNPFGSLSPVYTVGAQIVEGLRAHRRDLTKAPARAEALELIAAVGIDNPTARFDAFPHQISGGMRQRVVIAMAMANRPSLIVADEPTSALDVTVQAQVLDALETARSLSDASLLLITHDMGIVARHADRVLVMYAGGCVESGPTEQVFAEPRMPYTLGLLGAIPRIDIAGDTPLIRMPPVMSKHTEGGCAFADRCPAAQDVCRTERPALRKLDGHHEVACLRVTELSGKAPLDIFPSTATEDPTAPETATDRPPVLAVDGLVKHFPVRRRGLVHAVCDVSFEVHPGETLAVVGESGSGKTTLGRTLARLEQPTAGSIALGGLDITGMSQRKLRPYRSKLQMVLQDSTASLNPKLTVGDLLAEPLVIHGGHSPTRVPELLKLVGLPPGTADRFPGQLSGGQRQRVAIARALAVDPELLVLDEPVSALDVSVQADVLALLRDLQRTLGVAFVFVTHDLGVVRHVAHRVAVMYLGRFVEVGPVDEVLTRPAHPYTRALVSAVPVPDPAGERTRGRITLTGEIPAASAPPTGCRFRTRCPLHRTLTEQDKARCASDRPELRLVDLSTRTTACHFADGAAPVADGTLTEPIARA